MKISKRKMVRNKHNTPTIIRFPFEQMVRVNGKWPLVRLNLEEAFVPESFGKRAVGIGGDIAKSVCGIMGASEKNELAYLANGKCIL